MLINWEDWLMFLALGTAGAFVLRSRRHALTAAVQKSRRDNEGPEPGSLAATDSLTGVGNRYRLEAELERATAEALESGSRLAILYVGLDGFKPVNDAFGYEMGDRILCEVASRLQASVRGQDIVGRVGGDEFLVAMKDAADPAMGERFAQRLVDVVAKPFNFDGTEIELSASVGLSIFPDDGDAKRMIASADSAMRAAKRAGKNTWRTFSDDMTETSSAQVRLQKEIRRGLERDEFVLYYQPKVDSTTGRMVAVEALIRWRHPKRGLVPPGEFIPVAERFGLINALGNWTMQEACRQLRAWLNEGRSIPVALNLSPQQFRQTDLVERLRRLLAQYEVPANMLMLEITESSAMENPAQANSTIRELVSLGVGISIDDFGTGYSCLAYLRDLPAQQLKVDRSFVSEIDSSAAAKAICQTVIQLAHSLDLTVVAEGVETHEQAELLRALGCDELQGYLFSRPTPPEQVLGYPSAPATTVLAPRLIT